MKAASWYIDQAKSLFSQGGSEDSEEGGCLTRFSVVTAFEVHAPILTVGHCNKLNADRDTDTKSWGGWTLSEKKLEFSEM